MPFSTSIIQLDDCPSKGYKISSAALARASGLRMWSSHRAKSRVPQNDLVKSLECWSTGACHISGSGENNIIQKAQHKLNMESHRSKFDHKELKSERSPHKQLLIDLDSGRHPTRPRISIV